MASTELDPVFLKGLRLLHSKSKDSTDQLKQLLDEAIAQSLYASKEQNYMLKSEIDTKIQSKKSHTKDYSDFSSLSSSKQSQDEDRGRKRDHEKKHLDRIKQEDIEIIQEKIPKLESPQLISYHASSPDIPRLDHFVFKKVEEDSDSSDNTADADGFAMEMGLACVICKSLDVSAGNQLIECQECHSLYHQECHRPPAADYDVNDPRRVWYCAKCTKNMKKIASKTQKPSKPTTSIPPKDVVLQTRFMKAETTQSSSVLPFKRQELKAPVSQGNNQSSSNKPIGLAGLAANFSSRVTTAASSVSSSSSTRPISSKTTLPSSLKSYSNLSSPLKTTINSQMSSSSTSSLKISSGSSNSSSSSSSSFGAALMASSSVQPVAVSKSSSSATTSTAKAGLGLMTAASMSSRQQASSASNNGAKPTATCSLLMTADKRVQSMKKRAAKMQEKRRLITK